MSTQHLATLFQLVIPCFPIIRFCIAVTADNVIKRITNKKHSIEDAVLLDYVTS